MNDKITDLKKARQNKRQKTGWTMEEIKERAAAEFEKNKKTSSEIPEPENLVSGDMDGLLKEKGRKNDDEEC